MQNHRFFSPELSQKVELLKSRTKKVQLGAIHFDSPLLLAPMSAICNSSFRVLMETLGAGGTVSELVSCHGINYGNERTLKMLDLNPLEKNMGIQIFGENAISMAKAARIVEKSQPKFVDINMGCPVRKVVNNGGGSALLKDSKKLSGFFKSIKNAINIPLTIKIRTGWDVDSINASEVINIAKGEGIEFVSIHGRTRTQQYKGSANWDLLEKIKSNSPLPIVGNGDLHNESQVRNRLAITNCDALMLGRGPVRDPFIFLKPFINTDENISFSANDYLEVIRLFNALMEEQDMRPRHHMIQLRKHIVWFAQGFPGVAKFRQLCFQTNTKEDAMRVAEDYFGNLQRAQKNINLDESFMAGGHG